MDIPNSRHFHIDVIKAIATIIVVLTHVLAYHLGEKTTWWLWNYSHFVVVGLVFSSAYLYANSRASSTDNFSFGWFYKRFLRLYKPYFIYLIVHAFLMNVFPSYFLGYGWKKTMPFFIQNMTLTGGVDFGWLPLLFIQLAMLSPLLLYIVRSKSYGRIYAISILLFVSLTAFFRIPSTYSRLVAWIPWSSIAALGFIYSDFEKNGLKNFRKLSAYGTSVCAVIWIAFFMLLGRPELPFAFSNHKYPPDISYLSYGATFTFIILWLTQTVSISSKNIIRGVTFISKNSYTIFFVHFIFLDLVMTKFRANWIYESVYVLSGTLLVTYLIAKKTLLLRKLNMSRI